MADSIDNFKTMVSEPDKSGGYTLSPGDTLGQYRIVRSLGKGGMGEVYEVEHTTLERRYALKLLPTDFAIQPGALDRFRREAKVMANLDHPHILKVDEFGEVNGRYWLRMELAEGTGAGGQRSEVGGQRSEVGDQSSCASLEDLVKACGGKVPQELVLSVVRQVLAGLQYAHGCGAVHRDLKPSNILFSGDTAKIADFGLVRLVGEEWVRSQVQLSVQRSMGEMRTQGAEAGSGEGTSTRSMLGTFEYMSPEQKRGEDADARSDLYAVGVMAYRLLTGRNIGPKLPSRIDRELVEGWDDFVEQALEEDPSERLSDAAAGLGLLEEIGKQLFAAAKASQAVDEKCVAEERDRAERTRKQREAAARRGVEERLAAAAARKREQEQQRQAEEAAKVPPPVLPKKSGGGTKWVVGLLVLAGVIGYGLWQSGRGTGTPGGTRPSQPPSRTVVPPPRTQPHATAQPAAPVTQRSAAPSGERGPVAGATRTIDLGGGVSLEMVWIAPGAFMMGSPSSESNREDDETQHRVTLTKGFWMGKYEVTQEQWQSVMGSNPSNFKGSRNPVEKVSWDDCQAFIQKLNQRTDVGGQRSGGTFRLPTEAEWEYACRAGTTTPFHYGNDLDATMANFNGNYPYGSGRKGEYRQKTIPVGSFKPNAWGLYDMHGNVWEWCQDWYGDYPDGSMTDPLGPGAGDRRVNRGGSWRRFARDCRSAYRRGGAPGFRWDSLGFRLVRTE